MPCRLSICLPFGADGNHCRSSIGQKLHSAGWKVSLSPARGQVSSAGLIWLPENMSAHSRLTTISSSLLCHLVLSFLLPIPMETTSCLSNKCFFPKEPGQAKITQAARKQVNERELTLLSYCPLTWRSGCFGVEEAGLLLCFLAEMPSHTQQALWHATGADSLSLASGLDQELLSLVFLLPTHQHSLLTLPPKEPRIQLFFTPASSPLES